MLHTLIFLHLPKTAGTSFKFALQELLPPGALLYEVGGAPNHEVVRALMAMDASQRAQFKAIMAHVPYGLHVLFPEAKYVTMLREPVARILSTYYFAKSRTEFELSNKIAAGMTVEEFAADVFNDNAQVRRLLKYPDISRDDVFLDPPAGQLKSAHLDDAKDTLERCAVVGVAERYNEFLDCVAAEFGLPFIPRREDNVTAIPWHREDLSEQTIDRLREISRFDIELYAHAKKLAARQSAKEKVKTATAIRHMRPLYSQSSGREALETENERLGAETARLEAALIKKADEYQQALVRLRRLQEDSASSQTRLTGTIAELRLQLEAIYSSNSWRMTEPLRRLSRFAHRAVKRISDKGERSRP
jgi:sulfotransferase famil protein